LVVWWGVVFVGGALVGGVGGGFFLSFFFHVGLVGIVLWLSRWRGGGGGFGVRFWGGGGGFVGGGGGGWGFFSFFFWGVGWGGGLFGGGFCWWVVVFVFFGVTRSRGPNPGLPPQPVLLWREDPGFVPASPPSCTVLFQPQLGISSTAICIFHCLLCATFFLFFCQFATLPPAMVLASLSFLFRPPTVCQMCSFFATFASSFESCFAFTYGSLSNGTTPSVSAQLFQRNPSPHPKLLLPPPVPGDPLHGCSQPNQEKSVVFPVPPVSPRFFSRLRGLKPPTLAQVVWSP